MYWLKEFEMELYCDKAFGVDNGAWVYANTIGGGSYSVSNGVAVFNGASPLLYTSYLIQPGETIKFSVTAVGVVAGGIIAIDIEDRGEGNFDLIQVPAVATHDRYEIAYTCPLSETDGVVAIIAIGNGASFSSGSTVTRFYDPRVELIGGTIHCAKLRTMASGLIRLTTSGRGLHPTFFSSGVYSITVSSTDITVTLPHVYGVPSETVATKRPLVFVSATPDYGFLHAQAGGMTTDANSRLYFTIRLYDAAGAVLNPSTIVNAYIAFEVKSQ